MNELDEIAPSTQCTNHFRFTALRRKTDAAIVLSRDPLVNVEQWISFYGALVPCVLRVVLRRVGIVQGVSQVKDAIVHHVRHVLSRVVCRCASQIAALVRNHESLVVQSRTQSDK